MSSFIIECKNNVEVLLARLKAGEKLGIKNYKTLLEKTYTLLSTEDEDLYNLGLSVICHVADSSPQDDFINQLLHDCIIASRVFLYSDMYEKVNSSYEENQEYTAFDSYAKAFYTLDTETTLTKDQKKLFNDFQKYRRLVVSAPTSFGKSKIISEIIAHNNYNNIAIVLPTIALLSETYHKFRENKYLEEYNIVNSLTQPINDRKNILILTPERMDLFLDQHPGFMLDFFTMDEIYKIQGDERSKVFTHCLYRLSRMNADFYLIGPYFNKFSQNFLNRTNSKFRKYKSEIVQKDTYDLDTITEASNKLHNDKKFKKLRDKDKNLINLIKMLDGQSLVYVGKKQTVETRARKIAGQVEDFECSRKLLDLIDYVKENFDENWSLVKCLEKGVAFHHSCVPKYILSEVVDLFNEGFIDIIVCSPTLIEGVNTSAKNVIIYDDMKGDTENKLSGFDVKNIKGRAGRFSVHFVGRVIDFNKLPESEKESIEFSYFDNESLDDEEVIQVDRSELSGENLKAWDNIDKTLKELKIPMDLLRNNKFIPIMQQIKLIRYLERDIKMLGKIHFDGSYLEKEQLDKIVELCSEYLFKDREREDRNFALPVLQWHVKFYIYHNPTLRQIINNQNGESIDTKIRTAFKLITTYFEFALPRYLTAFESLFNFVYSQYYHGKTGVNLQYLITKLEFGYTNEHEIALRDAGVPNSIINKIAHKFSGCKDLEDIRLTYRLNPKIVSDLTPFERKIFSKYI